MLDSAHGQDEDARRANRGGWSRRAKALPLYTRTDARRVIANVVPVMPGRALRIGPVDVRLTPVGHSLGACAIGLSHQGGTLAFSGDVGRPVNL